MKSSQPTNPQQICENLLAEEKRYNIEHSILPSQNAVVDRLLARGIELKDAYEELHNKLHRHPPALWVFLRLIVSAAAHWSPVKIQEARAARDDLANVNRQIARKAAELVTLLEQRSELHDTSGFISNTHYHVVRVIEAASAQNYLFNRYVQKGLQALRGQFDMKYWPSLASLANGALDLGPDDLVDDAYVKRFRQRERNGAR